MLKRYFIGFASVLLLLLPPPCYADGVYTMTEAELTRLEVNMSKLEQITSASEQELTSLKNQLVKSDDELTRLNSQLIELRGINASQAASLQKANRYLQEYEAEVKRGQKRLKWQRNCGYMAALAAIIVAVAK